MTDVLERTVTQQPTMRGVIDKIFRQMFENTCQALEAMDGKKLREQSWNRDQKGIWTVGKSSEDAIYVDRALHNGNVFEKMGANYVAIEGELPPGMSFQQSGALATGAADQMITTRGNRFFATGSSFVIHPHNPMAPTAHVNYRYFQISNGNQPIYWWLGGGADLTPKISI